MRRLLVLVLTALLASTGTAAADVQVVGGERASIEANPWAVYLTDDRGAQFCGGTVVAPTKVLTAAHCALGRSPSDLRVVAGREDKQDRDSGVSVMPVDVWIHKQYVAADEGEDIAVLTLKTALPYTPLPIAEPSDRALYQPGTQLRALGWGRTSENGKTSRYLLQATVPVLPVGLLRSEPASGPFKAASRRVAAGSRRSLQGRPASGRRPSAMARSAT